METLKITASHEIIEKVKDFIQSFQNENVDVTLENETFLENRNYLRKQLLEIDSGKTIFYSLDEIDSKLDATLAKYENQNI